MGGKTVPTGSSSDTLTTPQGVVRVSEETSLGDSFTSQHQRLLHCLYQTAKHPFLLNRQQTDLPSPAIFTLPPCPRCSLTDFPTAPKANGPAPEIYTEHCLARDRPYFPVCLSVHHTVPALLCCVSVRPSHCPIPTFLCVCPSITLSQPYFPVCLSVHHTVPALLSRVVRDGCSGARASARAWIRA